MRRWLITGISSGIGAALAKAALARGDHVTGAARDAQAISAFEAEGAGRTVNGGVKVGHWAAQNQAG
ncbi:hypothetical protein [Sphingobium sp. CFD-2]|uniref:hypothetical protein n=1 Tax=Sphingobium sp. CFD-2 TaxID=2878542 RepID=UPI00214ACAD9|nr:hypothetical protein [Sphingobium sp. CFD-2]